MREPNRPISVVVLQHFKIALVLSLFMTFATWPTLTQTAANSAMPSDSGIRTILIDRSTKNTKVSASWSG
ncbi:MAG TPA: hypothetical protein VFA90_01295 [Terriglobales bacterium]|nr:hypothetical protein [Terriglobales bacterium]